MKPNIIVYMNSKLGLELGRHMLFLHAFTGLDKKNGYFTLEKAGFPKLLTDTMKSVAGNSTTSNLSLSDIFESGAQTMSLFFGGNDKPTLSFLRYNILVKKADSSKNVLYHQKSFHQLSRRPSIIPYRRASK